MKQSLDTKLFKPFLFVVAVLFLAVVVVTTIAGGSSHQVLAAPTTNNSGYLMLGGPDFVIRNVGFSDDISNLGLGIVEGAGYSAPLHLPQGAKISQITTYYTATTPISFTTYISVESQRLDVFNPIAASVIASISPTGNQTHTIQPNNVPVIDNSLYAYRVRIRTNGTFQSPEPPSPCPPGSTCRYSAHANNLYLIYQIRVDYSFESFLPSITR